MNNESTKITFSRPLEWPKLYEIDYDKIKTIENLVDILRCIDIRISEDNKNFKKIKYLLKGVENE